MTAALQTADPTFPSNYSRFYQRWAAADPGRAERVTALAALSLTCWDFGAELEREMHPGSGAPLPLPRALRRLRNLVVAGLILRDLDGRADLAEVVATMMVLAMGKQGGGELNVSSDIDLIFVYPEDGDTAAGAGQRSLSNHEFFNRLGKKLIAALAEVIEDGFVFRVDMALRPNGNSGPLVASLSMVEHYLIVQGREGERYAWVKARAVTGEAPDIEALDAIVRPFVYRRYLDFGVIDAIRTMHGQIRAEVDRQERLHPDRSNNVKLGRGGIREIEFLSQVFQLIRGGRDSELRDRSTRRTLRTLAQKNLLEPEVVEQLLEAYAFLRNLEHRLQYLDDAQTHTLPPNENDQWIIAQMMGYADVPALLAALDAQRRVVALQFDTIFNDKQDNGNTDGGDHGDTTCELSDGESAESIAATLSSLGFVDVDTATQRVLATLQSPLLQSLPEASRARLIILINAALPIIGAMPDTRLPTLRRLLDFFEAIARRAAYLALLTEYPYALTRLIRMIAASDWAAKYLTQHPLLLDELLDDRNLKAPPDWPAFAQDCQRQLDTAPGDTERQMDILREMHNAQLFRLLAQDLEGDLSVEHLADHLSALADILVAATIQA